MAGGGHRRALWNNCTERDAEPRLLAAGPRERASSRRCPEPAHIRRGPRALAAAPRRPRVAGPREDDARGPGSRPVARRTRTVDRRAGARAAAARVGAYATA